MALTPAFGGCAWPLDPACLTDEWEDFEPDVRDRAAGLASATLERLTAYRVGGCPVTVRPCRQQAGLLAGLPSFSGWHGGPFFPYLSERGYWVNSGYCGGDCTTDCEVALPGPIGRVDSVKVDGVVIPSTDYAVMGNALVWIGTGECPFPAVQDLSKPDTQPGTFSITYLNAYPVDSTGARAAALLAMQFARSCNGDSCDLPSTVRTVVRQGVTMDVITGAFPDGFTGIREVDAFISLWNPDGRSRRTGVWFPGINAPRHVTG